MLTEQETLERLYRYGATARDGRFTDVDVGNYEFGAGPVVLARPELEWPSPVRKEPNPRWRDPQQLAAIDAAATLDDTLAWGFAAMWWCSMAERQYLEAKAAAADPKRRAALVAVFHKWSGPDEPALAPTARPLPGDITGDKPSPLGRQDSITGGLWLIDGTWPSYFASMRAQIVKSTLARMTAQLVELQLALKAVAYVMYQMHTPNSPVYVPIIQDMIGAPAW